MRKKSAPFRWEAFERIEPLAVAGELCGQTRARSATSAFTLIELLVVVAIIGLLVSLTVPTIGQAIERARNVQCRSNLRQVGLIAHQYTHDNHGRLPDRHAWQRPEEIHKAYSLVPYLNLPEGRPTHSRLAFRTVLGCPTTLRYPGGPHWAFLRTYAINQHVSGSCRWRPDVFEAWLRGNRAPRIVDNVGHPSEAGFFFDSIRPRIESWSPKPYYDPFSDRLAFHRAHRFRAFFVHGMTQVPFSMGAGSGGIWLMASPEAMSPDDRINTVFLDGHVADMRRDEMEDASVNWETHPFFPRM